MQFGRFSEDSRAWERRYGRYGCEEIIGWMGNSSNQLRAQIYLVLDYCFVVFHSFVIYYWFEFGSISRSISVTVYYNIFCSRMFRKITQKHHSRRLGARIGTKAC
jgi:hypothetical protein